MFTRSTLIGNPNLILPLKMLGKMETITSVVESIAENDKRQRGKHFEKYFAVGVDMFSHEIRAFET